MYSVVTIVNNSIVYLKPAEILSLLTTHRKKNLNYVRGWMCYSDLTMCENHHVVHFKYIKLYLSIIPQ